MMSTLSRLLKMKKEGRVIGFTASSFDLLHAGHAYMLTEAKFHCDVLVVGLQTNPNNDRPDKNVPVQSILERWIQTDAIEHVDFIIPFDTEEDLLDLLLTLKPHVRFVGEEYKDKEHTGKNIPGIRIVYNDRKHSYSTTNLRERVVSKSKKTL